MQLGRWEKVAILPFLKFIFVKDNQKLHRNCAKAMRLTGLRCGRDANTYQILIYNALLKYLVADLIKRVSVKAATLLTFYSPAAMAKVAEEAGVYKATKHPLKTFYLAITAGSRFISICLLFLLCCDNRYWRDACLAWRNLSGVSVSL